MHFVIACGNVLEKANTGTCFKPLERCGVCDIDGVMYTFREFEYQGGVGCFKKLKLNL